MTKAIKSFLKRTVLCSLLSMAIYIVIDVVTSEWQFMPEQFFCALVLGVPLAFIFYNAE